MPTKNRMRTARESGPLLALFGEIFGLGYGCLLIPRVGGQLSPIWLPNAVLVAFLVAAPRMRWTLGLTVGGLAILAAHLAAGSAPVRAVGLTVCNLLEVLLAAVLIVRRFRGWPDMSRIRTVVEYDALVALAAFTGASLAAVFLWVTSGAPIGSDLLTWFTADAVGLVTVAPSLIVLASEWRERRPLDWRQGWPLLLLIAVTAAGFLQSYPFTLSHRGGPHAGGLPARTRRRRPRSGRRPWDHRRPDSLGNGPVRRRPRGPGEPHAVSPDP